MARRTLARAPKKTKTEGYSIVFIDESGFYLLPMAVRTWAPRGRTPVLKYPLTHDHLSAITAITPQGELYTWVQKHSFQSSDVIRFLKHLLRHIPGKLLVVWDGSPIHRSHVIKDFLADGAATRILLERLPGYAPDLNPDEGVWSYLKRVELKNACCRDLPHLRGELRKAIKRLRHKPRIIRGCINQTGLMRC